MTDLFLHASYSENLDNDSMKPWKKENIWQLHYFNNSHNFFKVRKFLLLLKIYIWLSIVINKQITIFTKNDSAMLEKKILIGGFTQWWQDRFYQYRINNNSILEPIFKTQQNVGTKLDVINNYPEKKMVHSQMIRLSL